MTILKITVIQVGHEYHARLAGTLAIYGKGQSPNEAVGDCFTSHPNIFKIPELTLVPYSGRVRAYLSSNPRIWGEGISKNEAIGNCIRYHYTIFHIIVE